MKESSKMAISMEKESIVGRTAVFMMESSSKDAGRAEVSGQAQTKIPSRVTISTT